MDGKQSQSEIASIFMHVFTLQSLYISVPTSDEQLNTINSSISEHLLHNNEDVKCLLCYTYVNIKLCHMYLKKNKSDGDKWFNSNHIINKGYRLSILLSFLFNAMLVYGYYPSELLKSTISGFNIFYLKYKKYIQLYNGYIQIT